MAPICSSARSEAGHLAALIRLDMTKQAQAEEGGEEEVEEESGAEEAADSSLRPLSASDVGDSLHDAQELLRAAERIVKESCGEDWLLQPFIPDMERNEYR